MIDSTDLRAGATFLQDGKPCQVIKYSFIKMGRGGATVKLTVRNLETGSVGEKGFSSNVTLDEVETTKRRLQFLYNDGTNAVFMDPISFEQVEIPMEIIKDELLYIKQGETANVLFWVKEGVECALSIEIPPKVALKVVDCAPGVKGNSATNIYKPAKLENGVVVKVPLFIGNNESVVVDTRTGEYVERAK